MTVLGLQADYI